LNYIPLLCYIQSEFITPDYLLVPAVYCVSTVHLYHEAVRNNCSIFTDCKTFQNPLFWGTSIAPTWEAFMASMFILVIAGNLEVLKWCGFMWHYVHTKFHKNPSVNLEERHVLTWWHHKPITMSKNIFGFMGNIGSEQTAMSSKFRSVL
jgi:hypothetical protein